MKVLIVLCLVSAAFALQPCANPATPYGAAQVQAAPFATPVAGAPLGTPFGGPGVPPVPVNPALMARLRPRVDQWTATLVSGNGEAHAALYATDSVIYPDRDYAYYGRVGARKWAVKNKAANIMTSPIQITDIMDGGSYLMMRGNMRDAKGPGDVVMFWADVNGQMLLKYMIYNWDTPVVPAQYDALGTMAVKQRVQTRMNEWSRLFEAGDMEALSQMYMEFSKTFPHTDFVYEGREGARKVYQDTRDSGMTKTTFMCMEADQVGDTITAWCYYRDYKGTEMFDEGTNVLVFKDVGGQLMIQYDIFNQEWAEANRTATEKLAEEYYRDWDTLFTAGNMPALVAKYEPDAVRILSGTPTVAGTPAIQQQLQTEFNNGYRYEFEVFTAMQVGNFMFVTGRQQTLKNDVVYMEGNFMDVMRMVGGKPKQVWDTYSIN